MASRADWNALMRDLTVERFTHVPENTGPVWGPSAWLMTELAANRLHALEVVVEVEFTRPDAPAAGSDDRKAI